MYRLDSRVRYSETDLLGRLSLTGIMNYLQDCSTLQSEDLGLGISYLNRIRRAWWLHSWLIEIDRYPLLGEKITVGTWPYDFKGIYGYRNFVIMDHEERILVKADSCWFFYDLERSRPARLQESDIRGYGAGLERLPMEGTTGKIELSGSFEEGSQILVGRHHLDTNNHVNNAQYVEMVGELIPENREIQKLKVEYKQAAALGDRIVPRYQRSENEITISLTDEDSKLFANLWMAMSQGKDIE